MERYVYEMSADLLMVDGPGAETALYWFAYGADRAYNVAVSANLRTALRGLVLDLARCEEYLAPGAEGAFYFAGIERLVPGFDPDELLQLAEGAEVIEDLDCLAPDGTPGMELSWDELRDKVAALGA